jgi:hypothetical protein
MCRLTVNAKRRLQIEYRKAAEAKDTKKEIKKLDRDLPTGLELLD